MVDAQGQAVATGDDEIACSATPVCGFSCPLTQFFCQSNEVYTVMVSDYGAAGRTCNAGGQYVLRAEGAATAGRSIDVFLLGNVRNLQPSARAIGLDAVAPFVDDGPIVRVFDHGAGTTVPGKGE